MRIQIAAIVVFIVIIIGIGVGSVCMKVGLVYCSVFRTRPTVFSRWRCQLLTYMLVLAVSATDLHVGVGRVSY